jgi:hypothetical protein
MDCGLVGHRPDGRSSGDVELGEDVGHVMLGCLLADVKELAICLLVRPSASSRRTSVSRGVRLGGGY